MARDWNRHGVAFDPDTDEEFRDIIGEAATASWYHRQLQEAFVAVHQHARSRGRYLPPHKVAELMQQAAIKYIDQQAEVEGSDADPEEVIGD